MIKNYFLVAWRNMIRNKAFSAINILGLALGMTCSLLILLWVQDERNVDGFHANGRQLYQVYERNYFDGKVVADFPTQGLMAAELKRQIPEVQYASSLEWNTTKYLRGAEQDQQDGRLLRRRRFLYHVQLSAAPGNTADSPEHTGRHRHFAENG
jgi:hypothetical protein